MQYVDGKDLHEVVRRKGPLAIDKAVNCVLQVAHVLQYAHEQGVVHRDIKPANVMFTDDRCQQAVITDFGIT